MQLPAIQTPEKRRESELGMRTKYNPQLALEMCHDYAIGMSVPKIAAKYGVSASFVYQSLQRTGLTRERDDRHGPGNCINVKAPFAQANKARTRAAAAVRIQAAADARNLRPIEKLVVDLRIEHPELSLAELGALCDPPMTKYAYAARLRRALETRVR